MALTECEFDGSFVQYNDRLGQCDIELTHGDGHEY